MDREDKFVVAVSVGSIVACCIGDYIGYFPFLVGDLVMREIEYCTMVICTVMAICTRIVLRSANRRQGNDPSEDKGEDEETAEGK